MKTALIVMMIAMSANVFAADPISVSNQIPRNELSRIHAEAISTLTSKANESLKEFLLTEVQPALRGFSDKTKFEGCGELAFNSTTKQYSVMLFSSQSHLACVVNPDKVQVGFNAMNLTVHSHGQNHQFTMNRADKIFTNQVLSTRNPVVYGENLEHFSAADFSGGAGFLTTPTTVRFQNGSLASECDIKVAGCASNF